MTTNLDALVDQARADVETLRGPYEQACHVLDALEKAQEAINGQTKSNNARPRNNKRAEQLVGLLVSRGPMTTKELVNATGCSSSTVYGVLSRHKDVIGERDESHRLGSGQVPIVWHYEAPSANGKHDETAQAVS